jgi:membrane protease YdiL (CAAX protease family)
VGAGIYEELLFRLIIMTLVIIVLADVLKFKMRWAAAAAVVVSALLFSAHHYAPIGLDSFSWGSFSFRAFAGAYLGIIFLVRGYGPAAGAHAAYNVMVVASAAVFP